jgi:hypothetical protein
MRLQAAADAQNVSPDNSRTEPDQDELSTTEST